VHPKSAGHGLNLQYGSNIIVFFSSGYNLEEDQQVIERIGPTRQVQAGFNRPVHVVRILARNTIDEIVLESLQTKSSIQSAIMRAMKKVVANAV